MRDKGSERARKGAREGTIGSEGARGSEREQGSEQRSEQACELRDCERTRERVMVGEARERGRKTGEQQLQWRQAVD